jgi:hypothetical protein
MLTLTNLDFFFIYHLDHAATNALSYTLKPELINGWQGSGYWYFFIVDWVGTNGVEETSGTVDFYLTN